MKLLCGRDAGIAAWVASRIPHMHGGDFGPCSAVGVLTDKEELLAGVVFHDWQPSYRTIQLSMAAESPRWARRGIIRGLLSYPFAQLDARKVWTATPHTNERALRFNKGIGFKREAVLARHFGAEHAVICRMFKHEYERRFLRNERHGQANSLTTADA